MGQRTAGDQEGGGRVVRGQADQSAEPERLAAGRVSGLVKGAGARGVGGAGAGRRGGVRGDGEGGEPEPAAGGGVRAGAGGAIAAVAAVAGVVSGTGGTAAGGPSGAAAENRPGEMGVGRGSPGGSQRTQGTGEPATRGRGAVQASQKRVVFLGTERGGDGGGDGGGACHQPGEGVAGVGAKVAGRKGWAGGRTGEPAAERGGGPMGSQAAGAKEGPRKQAEVYSG